MRIVVATSNQGKLAELQLALGSLNWQLESLAQHPLTLPPEVGTTFLQNALLKACYTAHQTGLPALSDDSGLEVDALDGVPGVYSARFGGLETDQQRNQYLLERLTGVPDEQRSARFVCVLVLAFPDGRAWAYTGYSRGQIAQGLLGEHGHGYDPLFLVVEAGQTFAQMPMAQKQQYSHRGRALQKLLQSWADR
jgi:XTP/dITP diphosphohydrolase